MLDRIPGIGQITVSSKRFNKLYGVPHQFKATLYRDPALRNFTTDRSWAKFSMNDSVTRSILIIDCRWRYEIASRQKLLYPISISWQSLYQDRNGYWLSSFIDPVTLVLVSHRGRLVTPSCLHLKGLGLIQSFEVMIEEQTKSFGITSPLVEYVTIVVIHDLRVR